MTTSVRLQGSESIYVLAVPENGMPVCVHWGPDGADVDLFEANWHDTGPLTLDRPGPLSIAPEYGLGSFAYPALLGHRDRRQWATEFELAMVREGPHRVTIELVDATAELALTFEVVMDTTSDVVARRATLRNTGQTPYALDWLAAAAFSLPETVAELMVFSGAWSDEFRTTRMAWPVGTWVRENRKTRSSRDGFAGLIAGAAPFGEDLGTVYGFHLGWSGPFRLVAEASPDGSRQVQMGTLLGPGELVLAAGETFTTPWAFGAQSRRGMNGLSQRFHRYLSESILPTGVAGKPRPVHLNTWEAVYFDHDVETLKDLADAAAEVGVERFVLDDGWFSGRDHDRAALGDWSVDQRKYPNGLTPLIEHVNALGMEFGLWVEPEMINEDSALYRTHPDWAMHLDGRSQPTGRHQLVLDLTRQDVQAYLFEQLDTLLTDNAIGYLKWDYNRDAAPLADKNGVSCGVRQTKALYDLLDRLRAAHPSVEIETCASGGGRVDFEVLRRTERFWTSDNNDAMARQQIHWGASLFFPLAITGAHVGPERSHQTGRAIDMDFRARTALFGHFGIEWDIRDLNPDQKARLSEHVAQYKKYRRLLHTGDLYRIVTGQKGARGMAVVGPDRDEAIVALIRLSDAPHTRPATARLPGLDPTARYRVRILPPVPSKSWRFQPQLEPWLGDGRIVEGAALAETGVRLVPDTPESIVLLHLERV